MKTDNTEDREADGRNSGGTRLMFREDLKDIRIESPRRSLNRQIAVYLNDGIATRPLFGLHQIARLTEYFVHVTRNGREMNKKYAAKAEDLFFKVRTRMKSILSSHGKEWRFSEEETQALRVFVLDIVNECRELHRLLHTNHMVTCPICGGKGTVLETTAVKAVQFAKKLLAEKRITRDEIPFAMF